MSFVAVAIGAGAGLLKSEAIDAPKADRQRKLAAETQRYSPWTGLKANPVQEADPVGSALQFGATGAQLSSGMQNADAQKGLMEAQTNWLNKGGKPQYAAALSPPVAPGGVSPYTAANKSPWSLGGDFKF